MAQTIKLKRSATPGAIPSLESLELGEIAINTYDGKVYIKKDDGTSPDTIVEVSGTGGLASGDLSFLDNEKAIFGTGSDLQIYHDGSNSYATSDTGQFFLTSSNSNIWLRGGEGGILSADGSEYLIRATSNGSVKLYHNNVKKLETTTTGIDVTGSVTSTTGFTTAANTRVQSSSGMLFLNGPSALTFEVGAGSEKMRLTSTGLGIGTSSPALAGGGTGLHINATSYPELKFTNSTTGAGAGDGSLLQSSGNNFSIQNREAGSITFSTSNTVRATLDASGNLGIGTTSITSGFKLEVTGDARFGDAVGDDAVELGWSAGGSQGFIQAYDRGASAFRPLNINNSLIVDASGNVGIGISPQSFSDLMVNTATDRNISVFDNAAGATIGGLTDAGASAALRIAGSPLIFTGNGGAGAEHMRIDASGNVEIKSGNKLVANRGDNARNIQLFTDNSFGTIETSDDPIKIASAVYTRFDTAGTERMRIDASGVIGVNTPSAAQISAGFGQITLNGTSGGVLNFTDDNVEKVRVISEVDNFYVQVAGSTIFRNGGFAVGDEAMRIDASGNLLVGTTSNSVYNDVSGTGIALNAGQIQIAGTGATLYLNRQGSDGAIAEFRKDGTTVGSIGTISGSMYIEGSPSAGKAGLTFYGSYIEPRDNGAAADAAIDLGASAGRFKDLYLSGGVRGTSTIDITVPETSGSAIQLEFGNNVNDTRRTVRAYKDKFEPAAADTGVISLGQDANKWKDLYLSSGAYASFIAGQNDTNTSINFPGSDVTVFYTGGAERMRIDAGGNVGIGTDSPEARLHIAGDHILLNNALEIRSKDTGGSVRTITRVNSSDELEYGWSAGGPVKFMGGGSYTERMRIHTNGNIGIGVGTNNPDELLHVFDSFNNTGTETTLGTTGSRATIKVENDAAQEGAYASLFLRAGTADARIAVINTDGAVGNTADLVFIVDDTVNTGTERMRIVGETGNATFTGAIKAPAYKEEVGISSTTSGTFNIDVYDNSVLLLDTAMTANWTINVRGDNIFQNLNSVLAVGESITVVCLATQGVTPYYNSVMQINSVTQTVKWQGGTAPTAGNASSVDSYSYTIIKTASSTYTVLGNLTQFA